MWRKEKVRPTFWQSTNKIDDWGLMIEDWGLIVNRHPKGSSTPTVVVVSVSCWKEMIARYYPLGIHFVCELNRFSIWSETNSDRSSSDQVLSIIDCPFFLFFAVEFLVQGLAIIIPSWCLLRIRLPMMKAFLAKRRPFWYLWILPIMTTTTHRQLLLQRPPSLLQWPTQRQCQQPRSNNQSNNLQQCSHQRPNPQFPNQTKNIRIFNRKHKK